MIQNDFGGVAREKDDGLDAIIDNRGVVYRESHRGAMLNFFVVIVIANSQRRLALPDPCRRSSFPQDPAKKFSDWPRKFHGRIAAIAAIDANRE